MTTANPEAASLPPLTIDTSQTARVPFLRLVSVEWRKMMDTRAGFWLLAITGLLLLLAMGITLLVAALDDSVRLTASGISEIMVIPVSLLVPVFAVLVVTSEWSQRTHLVTFTLEPHRLRTIFAKLAAVSVLAVATIAVAIVVGAVGNVLYGAITGNEVTWNVEASTLVWTVITQVLFFLMGFGLGMLILNTPGAVAIFYLVGFLLPFMVYSTLYVLFDWARDILPWIDMTTASMPLISGTDYLGNQIDAGATEYLQYAVTIVLWVVVPVVLGAWRVLRTEAK